MDTLIKQEKQEENEKVITTKLNAKPEEARALAWSQVQLILAWSQVQLILAWSQVQLRLAWIQVQIILAWIQVQIGLAWSQSSAVKIVDEAAYPVVKYDVVEESGTWHTLLQEINKSLY